MMFFLYEVCPSETGVTIKFFKLTPSESGGDIFSNSNATIVNNLKWTFKKNDLTSNETIGVLKRKILEVFSDNLIKIYLISGFDKSGSVENYIEPAEGNNVSELTTEISDSSENKVKELIESSISRACTEATTTVNVYFYPYEKDKQSKEIPDSGKKIVKISKGCCCN